LQPSLVLEWPLVLSWGVSSLRYSGRELKNWQPPPTRTCLVVQPPGLAHSLRRLPHLLRKIPGLGNKNHCQWTLLLEILLVFLLTFSHQLGSHSIIGKWGVEDLPTNCGRYQQDNCDFSCPMKIFSVSWIISKTEKQLESLWKFQYFTNIILKASNFRCKIFPKTSQMHKIIYILYFSWYTK